jgi:glutaredoxin 3
MKLAYVRTSKHDKETTIARLAKAGTEGGWQLQPGVALPSGGVLYQVCKPDWVESLVRKSPQLIGLLPCTIAVFERDHQVVVATGNAALLGEVSGDPQVQELAATGDLALRTLVNTAADVSDPKPVGVKLYSSHTCPYCRMEKAWLDGKQVAHTVVYVDDDEKEAQRLVDRTGQMGVPVTEIEYDAGDPEFIVGFDKKRLEGILVRN